MLLALASDEFKLRSKSDAKRFHGMKMPHDLGRPLSEMSEETSIGPLSQIRFNELGMYQYLFVAIRIYTSSKLAPARLPTPLGLPGKLRRLK